MTTRTATTVSTQVKTQVSTTKLARALDVAGDSVSTLEANVLRMAHGITAKGELEHFASYDNPILAEKLAEMEAGVLARAVAPGALKKAKIIAALRNRQG